MYNNLRSSQMHKVKNWISLPFFTTQKHFVKWILRDVENWGRYYYVYEYFVSFTYTIMIHHMISALCRLL